LTCYVHVVHILAMTQTKLDLWMGSERDDQWLANAVGCSRSQASRIRRGKSVPSLETAVAIERVTKGKVRPADLLISPACPAAANDDDAPSEAA
jgi:DNA-binding XRE family transcriptional regulator